MGRFVGITFPIAVPSFSSSSSSRPLLLCVEGHSHLCTSPVLETPRWIRRFAPLPGPRRRNRSSKVRRRVSTDDHDHDTARAAAAAEEEQQQSSPSSSSGGKGRKAQLSAKRIERVILPDCANGDSRRNFPINEFLSHPSGVAAILNTRALHSFEALDANTYRCTLQCIQFLKYEVIPVVVLRLTYTNNGCTVEMLSCKFEGSEGLEQQNGLFSAFMRNHITWEQNTSETFLDFDVHLSVTLQVYTVPFTLLPTSAVETPGNLIMQGIIDRLVPLLIQQLLEDYRSWVEEKLRFS